MKFKIFQKIMLAFTSILYYNQRNKTKAFLDLTYGKSKDAFLIFIPDKENHNN